MRRRDFIILGGFSVAWPLAARAQQTAKLPTIGFLGAGRASGYGKLADAFATRMRELGWVEGRTIAINYRWAEGNTERLADIAAEFVRLKVDVIVTNGNVAIAATKRATSQIPIVFGLLIFLWDAIAASGVETWLLGPRRWRANPRRLGFRGRRFYWFALPAEAAVQRQALARSRSVPRQRNKTAKAEKQR
jgi:ABC transporter substrate binding protein